jgi:ssDNA-binding Zn-finger/Zn-ribbon topoisomerase 1
MNAPEQSAIAPYTVRVVQMNQSWTVWGGGTAGVTLQIHGGAGEVLEVDLSPNGGDDALVLRRYKVGEGWQALYHGPVAPLQEDPAQVACPKCRHAWVPQTKTGQPPQKCPQCSYRVGAHWRRQAAAPRQEETHG